jgi:hypothetical protein
MSSGMMRFFPPKPPPYVRRDDADLMLGQAERLGEANPLHVAALGRQVDDELVEPVIPIGEHAAAFERDGRLPVGSELPPQPDGRGGQRRHVALVHGAGDEGVVGPCVEQASAARAHRRDAIDDGRQLLHVQRHLVGQVLGLGARGCETGGDRLADVAHALVGERRKGTMAKRRQFRAGLEDVDRAYVGQREDARGGIRRLDDLPQAGMRHLAAHEGDVLQAGHADIGDEHAGAEEIARILLAQQACTDPTAG